MQDLDSYKLFCAIQLLNSKSDKNLVAEDEVVCACAQYLNE
jgi:hypothetical protein